jgi:S1-C subfamily serine protease
MIPQAMKRTLLALVFLLAAGTLAAQDKPEEILSAVVGVQAKVRPNARSAATLGPERRGTGVLIREGFVLTIGYLVVEAESVQVTSADGRVLPASVAAYDHASGFALLRLLAAGSGKPLKLGDPTALTERDPAMVVTAPARDSPSLVYIVSRRPFSGSWEYLLDSAIFTYPPVEEWSGAPLISSKGELLGIGSLVVRDAAGPGAPTPGNMFVPVDLLKPILEDLIADGHRKGPARPWLGINADEVHGHLFVSRVSPEGPADRAGVRDGDIVIAVGGDAVTTLAEFYRKVWGRGEAGVEVPLRVLQGAQLREINVRSVDRASYFRPALTY